jgi:hypothetical protein
MGSNAAGGIAIGGNQRLGREGGGQEVWVEKTSVFEMKRLEAGILVEAEARRGNWSKVTQGREARDESGKARSHASLKKTDPAASGWVESGGLSRYIAGQIGGSQGEPSHGRIRALKVVARVQLKLELFFLCGYLIRLNSPQNNQGPEMEGRRFIISATKDGVREWSEGA